MNLPNAVTAGRIAITPLVALLPFVDRWEWRVLAFVLFLVAAISDYYDGMLARTRNQITRLGQLLDPAGRQAPPASARWCRCSSSPAPAPRTASARRSRTSPVPTPGPLLLPGGAERFPFVTPLGLVGLPWWILAIVLGREALMTVFRQFAARRGVVIAAIGPAKWKTAFQSIWVGATYFWIFAATMAGHFGWTVGAVARLRALQRHRRHACHARRHRAHAVFAAPLRPALRLGARRLERAGELERGVGARRTAARGATANA